MFSLTLLATIAFANSKCAADDEFCGQNTISEPIRSCSENFFYDEVQQCCISEISYPAMLRCPAGGDLPGPDGVCECNSQPLTTCPEGMSYDTHAGECVSCDRVAMIPSCAHRADLAGVLSPDASSCFYLQTVEPRPLCSSGSKLREGMCVSYDFLPVDSLSFICPDGWEFDASCNECVLVEDVDCKHQRTRKTCKATKIKDCATEPFVPCGDDCVLDTEHNRRLSSCDRGQCKEKVKPEHACQAAACKMGYKEKDSKSKSFVQPVACQRVTTLAAKAVCSVGTFVKSKSTCGAEVSTPAQMVCPHGCVDAPLDAAPQVTSAVPTCTKQLSYLTDFVCPSPYTVSCSNKGINNKHGQEGGKKTAHPSNCECVLLSSSPAIPTCPDGLNYNPEKNVCVEAFPAVPYCAERDAVLVNGVCTRTLHEPARLEYTVTYLTEQPCEFDQCIKEKIPIKKRKVVHKEVKVKNGKSSTKCDLVECVNVNGEVLPPASL